jgi:cobalt-zinc-cadmium resistance protein CzcA
MISTLIDAILAQRLLVVACAVALLLGGLYAFQHLNIEAYPDPSPPTIEVIAQNPGWSAEEMERQITVPIEIQLNGMPGLDHLRSISLVGLTDIKCYFTYTTNYTLARQEVLNRLQLVQLPAGVQPQLSPTSAIGEIYRYQLVGEGQDLMALKEAEDWILERQFKQVPGVIDVVSFGGQTKEFHIDLDPTKLIAFNVSISQVLTALANSNANVGANYLELGRQSYNIRGLGLFKTTQDMEQVVVAAKNGTPIYLKQLGEVRVGAKVPTGRVGKDGARDIVQGIVLMRRGEQSLPTLARVRQKVAQLNHGLLPKGMRVVPYYDRTDLIHITTETVTHTLLAGMALVALILLAFLGDLRASLVVALSIPLALLFTFIMLVLRGESANLISMGAIDFGIIVDASVVMVENIYRHLAELGPSRAKVRQVSILAVQLAAQEVSRPIFFSSAIIVVAFLPLFTMQGVEGQIFGPMALTYGFALTGALILALTFSPVMASLVLSTPKEDRDTLLVRGIKRVYAPLLRGVLAHPGLTVVVAGLALGATLATVPFIGGEFMPKLEEGNLWVRATMPITIAYSYASDLADQMRAIFRHYPEVTTVVSQLGRPEDGTDPTSYFNCEFFVNLKPRAVWRKGLTKPALVRQLEADLQGIPGVKYNFSQNIQDNVEEAMSGVKGENSLKLFGDDLNKLEVTAGQIERVMQTVPGIADLSVFRSLGQPNLLIQVNRERAARYGVLPGDVNGTVQAAIGGQVATQVLDGDRRFDVVVRFLPQYRASVEAIANIPVSTPDGSTVPLTYVADMTKQTGASFIYREDNARYIPIKFSVRGRDLQSTLTEAERQIRSQVRLPEGYTYRWAGEFEELQAAIRRLQVIVPVSLLLIFCLLYGTFRSLRDAVLVLGAVPLALLGGMLSLLVTHTTFSISAAVGFISLFGVAVLDGVILVSYIKGLRAGGFSLHDAVVRGATIRLRPVLMTALAAAIGLFPAAVATGIGSETQQPLARVVVGGMVTAPVLILLVLPALYSLAYRAADRRTPVGPSPTPQPHPQDPSVT